MTTAFEPSRQPRLILLIKGGKIAHQAGYYLLNGRWHSVKEDKPVPKNAPKSAHPHAAGKPIVKETFADHEWAQLKLPAENVNAGTFNKQLDQLKAAAAAGDVTGIVGSGYGVNTYGKKLAIIANKVLGILGSDHTVTPGQKAGSHAAVQTAPEIEAQEPAPEPAKTAVKPEPKAEAAPVPDNKPDDKLVVPEFKDGVQAKGVKAYYEKVAKKIISAAEKGDLSALQFMPTDKGNTWKGKTDNSKSLLALHKAAIEHAHANKSPGKDIQHPDAEKTAKREEKELAKEHVTPAEEPKKVDPKPVADKPMKNYGWKAVDLANAYSIDQLEKMMKQVEAEHYSPNGIQLYDKAGQKKLDALTWAITHIAAKEKKTAQAQPKPEEQEPKAAEPKLSQIPWDAQLLPDSNKNAKSHNGKVAHIKAMAEAGDMAGLEAFKAGTNTYGKKQNLLAQTALAALQEDAPAVAGKPADKPIPPLPVFKTTKEMEDWADTQAFKDWSEAGLAKYGSKAAWFKAPETKEFNDLYAKLPAKAVAEATKEPADKSPSGDIPTQPKISDFNTDQVAKAWVKMAKEGKVPELMASISTLANNAKKQPKSFDTDDGQALLGFAKQMASWVSHGSTPVEEPASAPSGPQKPTGLKSVHWNSVVDGIEKAISEKDVGHLLNEKLGTAGLDSDEAKQVHAYADAAIEHLISSAEKDTPASGPKEGETKQGADGMLVFQNGRWHKVGEDEPAEKDAAKAEPHPIDAHAEFDFSTFKYPQKAKEGFDNLIASVKAEGASGLKGVIKKMNATGKLIIKLPMPNGATYKVVGFAGSESVYTKLYNHIEAMKGALGKAPKVAKPKPAPQPAAAPAQEPSTSQPVDSIDSWEQVGPQGGSNPGGKFKDADGFEWYCKFPPNEEHAKAEVLAAKLYAAAGISGQDAKLITKDGKIGIASRWQTVSQATPAQLKKTPGVLDGFATDAWLANWDVVGMGLDNLQVDEKGNAMRVDAGGSLMYRAQGSKKAFGENVTELDSLRDAALNPQAASVFGKMTKADITASVAKVAAISDATIRITVNAHGPGTKAEKKALADILIARKNDLLAKYPNANKEKKKRLDPTKLPVKEDRLPKLHDFNNWNGAGQPLSSQKHVNDANNQVEQEMHDIAKSGNLTKLKDYKYQPIDKTTGLPTGQAIPIAQHPSKHVVQLHADLLQVLDEVANPPQALKIFQATDVGTLEELEVAFPSKKFGTTVKAVHSNEKLGFWVVLGGALGAAEKFKPQQVMNFTSSAISAAKTKFQEASKLAKHFVHSVQASGSYNDLFRDGKEMDSSGNKLSDVAQAALELATEQPEGTSIYRWQNMSEDMVKKIMSAPDGSVFQATGPMCTSYSATATSHFGKHRLTVRYAKGAKAVESFGSGGFSSEKEVTTLPNSRFVILKKEMVANEKGSGQRMELEVLMLPPDLGI